MKSIDTARVSLRPARIEDLEELFSLTSMPQVNRFNPDGPDRDIAQAHQQLAGWINDWESNGIGYHTARQKNTGAYIGYVGLTMREFRGEQLFNLAYRIRPEFQGQGIVTEACHAILDAARTCWTGYRVRALTKKDNAPSIAVACRLGLVHDPSLDDQPELGDVNFFLRL